MKGYWRPWEDAGRKTSMFCVLTLLWLSGITTTVLTVPGSTGKNYTYDTNYQVSRYSSSTVPSWKRRVRREVSGWCPRLLSHITLLYTDKRFAAGILWIVLRWFPRDISMSKSFVQYWVVVLSSLSNAIIEQRHLIRLTASSTCNMEYLHSMSSQQ